MKLSGAVLSLFFISGGLAAGEIPVLPDAPPPGMERGQWSAETWGNSGTVEKVTIDGAKLVKFSYKGEKKEKAAFKHATYMGIDREGKVRLNVYTDEDKPPQISLAVTTTRAFRWHESKLLDLKKGWNKLEFSVGLKEWKTQTSDWKYTVPVEPADDVRAIDVIIYNGDRNGAVFVQGLSYDPDENGRKAALLIKDLRSEDRAARAKAERALVAIGKPATEALHQVPDDERPEVLIRVASALRQIESLPEEMPLDPKQRAEIEKKLDEKNFDDARKRADGFLRGLDSERGKLAAWVKDVQTEVAQNTADLEALKQIDPEKKKAYEETLKKLDALSKEVDQLLKALPPPPEVKAPTPPPEVKPPVEPRGRKFREKQLEKEKEKEQKPDEKKDERKPEKEKEKPTE